MGNDKSSDILLKYEEKRPSYADFSAYVADLLRQIISAEGISIHSVTHRTKTASSLRDKISRPDKSYDALEQITDLAGIRVTTYFPDDIDKVAALIDRELDIDKVRSIDKRISKTHDAFGYSSVHKICALGKNRVSLSEYRRFKGLTCEIQVRSILQHTWAEIEHDLGYKTSTGVPDHLKRRFSKLAALLELADDEFMRLRDDLHDYAQQIRTTVKEKHTTTQIDNISLRLFIEEDSALENLDDKIAKAMGSKAKDVSSDFIERRVNQLKVIGISNLTELRERLEANSDLIFEYSIRVFSNFNPPILMHGYSIFALVVLSAARLPSEEETVQTLLEFGIEESIARKMSSAARTVLKTSSN